jgi:hypothetical protein
VSFMAYSTVADDPTLKYSVLNNQPEQK